MERVMKQIGMGGSLVIVMVLMLGVLSSHAEEPAAGKQVAQVLKVKQGDKEVEVRYWLFLPKGYEKKKDWPVMLFMHGAGERGDDLAKVKAWGPPKLVEKRKDFPFVVISPQCPRGTWWNAEQMKALVEHVIKTQKIDKSRVYCTGLSMGGYGTWDLLGKYPKLFTAAVPICGGGKPAMAKKMVDIPIWAFHGDQDRAVPLERSVQMVEAIKAAGGEKAKLTIYKGVDHNSWSKTYANEKVYEWLLKHKKGEAKKKG